MFFFRQDTPYFSSDLRIVGIYFSIHEFRETLSLAFAPFN
jgi:hypothetical protein